LDDFETPSPTSSAENAKKYSHGIIEQIIDVKNIYYAIISND
jgi:hypothetical protein